MDSTRKYNNTQTYFLHRTIALDTSLNPAQQSIRLIPAQRTLISVVFHFSKHCNKI